MPKPDHIADLERRQKVLEDEIAKAILHCSADDPMILDLKRPMLHLRDELEEFGHQAVANRSLHKAYQRGIQERFKTSRWKD